MYKTTSSGIQTPGHHECSADNDEYDPQRGHVSDGLPDDERGSVGVMHDGV